MGYVDFKWSNPVWLHAPVLFFSLGYFTEDPEMEQSNLTVVVANKKDEYFFQLSHYNVTEFTQVEPGK